MLWIREHNNIKIYVRSMVLIDNLRMAQMSWKTYFCFTDYVSVTLYTLVILCQWNEMLCSKGIVTVIITVYING
jgi:hypothetical protein